jgi:hypothetical protein
MDGVEGNHVLWNNEKRRMKLKRDKMGANPRSEVEPERAICRLPPPNAVIC